MTVKINRHAGKAPGVLVASLVGTLSYPQVVMLQHKNDKPLVIPSSGINTPIEPGVPTPVKVKSLDQVWMLVSDLSEFAHRANNDSEDFAVLARPDAEGATQQEPQLSQEAQEASAGSAVVVDPISGGAKPARTRESK